MDKREIILHNTVAGKDGIICFVSVKADKMRQKCENNVCILS